MQATSISISCKSISLNELTSVSFSFFDSYIIFGVYHNPFVIKMHGEGAEKRKAINAGIKMLKREGTKKAISYITHLLID